MKPILFNTEMVRAILDSRKNVTLRVIKPQPPSSTHPNLFVEPPYRSGDILYVRETFRTYCGTAYGWYGGVYEPVDDFEGYNYRADDSHFTTSWLDPFDDPGELDHKCKIEYSKWRPSIHMPKEAARLFLRVTGVQVERLQEITEEQARLEGVKDPYEYQKPEWYEKHGLVNNYSHDGFAGLWDSTLKKADRLRYGWDANPWVWVIEFERISKEEALKNA